MKKTSNNLLSRRETLRLLGAAGATALWGGKELKLMRQPGNTPGAVAGTPFLPDALRRSLFYSSTLQPATRDVSSLACVVRPALTEGPYFVDELLNRSDIRSDPSTGAVKAGVPLKLKINLFRTSDGSACAPLAGAQVDIWHCDALGAYSDVSAGGGNPNTLGQEFLRGYQLTDSNGSVEFTTIYPGYYTGRTTHIHYKVRIFSGSTQTYEFTSQLCFDDSLTDQVYTLAPYNTKSARGTRNSNDNIYQSAGSTILLSLTPDGQGGYTTTYDIGLSGVPATVGSVSTVSAASFAQGPLASEAIAALFGVDLASDTVAASATPLPTQLGGVQVIVRDALGTERAAPLFFVSPGQVNLQIPAGTSTGSGALSVLRDNTAVGQGTVTIERVAPGLFSANTNGQGVPAAIALRDKADGTQTYEAIAQFDSVLNRFVPVPIEIGPSTEQLYLIVFGTGFRYQSALSAVTCAIGGTNAEVVFAGAQGAFAGLDQANIVIPRSLAGRGDVDLIFSADGRAANTVSLNIE